METSPTSTPTKTKTGGLKLLSINDYSDSLGFLHIIGEVENTGAENYLLVTAVATLYDKDGNVLDTGSSFALKTILGTNEKAPFDVVFTDPPKGVAKYRVKVEGITTYKEPYRGLILLSHNIKKNALGLYEVIGEIKNVGDCTVSSPMVVVTGYDDSGEVVAVGSGFTSISNLAPGEKSPFKIYLSSTAGEIDSYSIIINGECS